MNPPLSQKRECPLVLKWHCKILRSRHGRKIGTAGTLDMRTKTLIACLATGLLTLGEPARAAGNPGTAPSHTASFESRHHPRQTTPARDPLPEGRFRRDSARDPRRPFAPDAQSVRAGEIRHSGRERLAGSRRPRKRERNQLLQHFFLAVVMNDSYLASGQLWPCPKLTDTG